MRKVSAEALAKVQWLLGDADRAVGMASLPPLEPFYPAMTALLSGVAKQLRADARAKEYPEVATFGFWCRKASLHELARPYQNDELRTGRGMAFHIAPSNVPVNFAYSLAAGLLAGNACVVRVPSQDFAQVGIIADAFAAALAEQPGMAPYLALCRYGHDQAVNNALSALSDARVIWGGDDTIAQIRRSPLPPRAVELCFADRYSLAVIDADAYLDGCDADEVARGFYNDTYLTDQNACTSPRLVVWLGERVPEAQERFWGALGELVQRRYELAAVQAVSKLHALCAQAALAGDAVPVLAPMPNNLITRVQLPALSAETMREYGHSGYFMEYAAANLEEIAPICGGKCQTLAYVGVEMADLRRFVERSRPRGVDRIVPLGKTMDFALVWDGYDLIRTMSRVVEMEQR